DSGNGPNPNPNLNPNPDLNPNPNLFRLLTEFGSLRTLEGETMTARQKFFVALAACHLALVTYHGFLPALNLPPPARTNPAGLAVNWYGAMSGSSNSYGFFKFIGGTCRVRFQM